MTKKKEAVSTKTFACSLISKRVFFTALFFKIKNQMIYPLSAKNARVIAA